MIFYIYVNMYLKENYFNVALSEGLRHAGSEMVHFGENLNCLWRKYVIKSKFRLCY